MKKKWKKGKIMYIKQTIMHKRYYKYTQIQAQTKQVSMLQGKGFEAKSEEYGPGKIERVFWVNSAKM